ncbi:MAG: hypothetical protein ACO1OF_01970 [Adhaeribacter sp.]
MGFKPSGPFIAYTQMQNACLFLRLGRFEPVFFTNGAGKCG